MNVRFMLYSLAANYAILAIWFFAFVLAHDWMRGIHGRWFQLSDSTFDAIRYGGMAFYKILIFKFNLVPLIALYFVGGDI